jgi:hypothetical protein
MRGKFSTVTRNRHLAHARKRNPLAALSLLKAALQLARVAVPPHRPHQTSLRALISSARWPPLARTPLVWRVNDDTLYRPPPQAGARPAHHRRLSPSA